MLYIRGLTVLYLQVLFFGDSLRSDIYPSKNYASWDTVMLVEEMQAEDLSMKKEEEMTAATKRQKMCRVRSD